jgi:hypothetical protein
VRVLKSFWLVHPEPAMCDAFAHRFAGLPGVRVVRGRFEDLEPHDCFGARSEMGVADQPGG